VELLGGRSDIPPGEGSIGFGDCPSDAPEKLINRLNHHATLITAQVASGQKPAGGF
jgi:hypothetical protein